MPLRTGMWGRGRGAALLFLGAMLGLALPGAAQQPEVEGNDSCGSAQELDASSLRFQARGSLEAGDVDYFRFSAEPGTALIVDHEGFDFGGGAIGDPLLGWFNSACELLALDDDLGIGFNSRLQLEVPADGVVILAASGFLDDEFSGSHFEYGGYRLRIGLAADVQDVVAVIGGHVVDVETLEPIADPAQQPFVLLRQCDELEICRGIAITSVGADGRFAFESTPELPLAPGYYQVLVDARGYGPLHTSPTFVGAGEVLDLGDLELEPGLLQISGVEPCAVPVGGGECRYSVRVRSRAEERVQGLAWSVVNAFVPDVLEGSRFEAGVGGNARIVLRPTLRLAAGGEQRLEFSVDVPAATPVGTVLCPRLLGSLQPLPLLVQVLDEQLFCAVVGEDRSVRTLSGTEALLLEQRLEQGALRGRRKRSRPAAQ